MRIRVVLPQPDGPRRQVTSDSGKAKVTSSTALSSLNDLVSRSTRISDKRGSLPDPFAVGGEEGEVVRVERDHRLIVRRDRLGVVPEHGREGRAVDLEIDDLFAAEVLSEKDCRLDVEAAAVRFDARFERDALRPDPDSDLCP